LARCAACRAELEGYGVVFDLLAAAAPAAEPPAGLELRILRGLKTTRTSRARRRALLAMATVLVSALVRGNVLQWTGVIRYPGPAGATPLLTASLLGHCDARGAYGAVVLDMEGPRRSGGRH